jgi:hypothetical protein
MVFLPWHGPWRRTRVAPALTAVLPVHYRQYCRGGNRHRARLFKKLPNIEACPQAQVRCLADY